MIRLFKHLLKQREEPSLSSIAKNKRIVILGDDHNMDKGREWLAKEIRNGLPNINFLALEYIETDKQKLIDKFDKKEIISHLKHSYKDFPGFSPNSILKLIASSKRAKLQITAIEIPEKSFQEWNNKTAQKARTKFISQQITKISERENGLVLLGADHAEKMKDNVYGQLKKTVGEIVSVVFIGGKNWTIDTDEYWIRKLEIEIKKERLDKKMFALNVVNHRLPCDWIIHFPQE